MLATKGSRFPLDEILVCIRWYAAYPPTCDPSHRLLQALLQTNKNDAADAEAICEAVTRPNMRFVPIKNDEQQNVLALHRVRQGFVKARTAQANQIRGLLSEFGLIIPRGIGHIARWHSHVRSTAVP